ncbi:hypothetical protein [Streptomyces sp. NBC_01483]|uniref:hypothetical protein n=1 Tax=Streptomyces sp. NBC_01483 TaxID=2903883 RepID=UPI002E328398|nr:hypothetical protein [Streptomyces sp. NBC_01483]
MDSSNNIVKRINLLNAWASSWSADGSGPATETVQIEFDDVVIEEGPGNASPSA